MTLLYCTESSEASRFLPFCFCFDLQFLVTIHCFVLLHNLYLRIFLPGEVIRTGGITLP